MLTTLIAFATAAIAAPESTFSWQLSVDGQPVGTRHVRIHTEGPGTSPMRFVEAFTTWETLGTKRSVEPPSYQHRLTASGPVGEPASFHSTQRIDGRASEVQARYTPMGWRVTGTGLPGPDERILRGDRVDLTTVDLLDPHALARLQDFDQLRLLDATTGAVTTFTVVSMGPRQVTVGDDTVWTDGWELRTAETSWRLHLTTAGLMVRLDAPLGSRRVVAELLGPLPRPADDFQVELLPTVEEVEAADGGPTPPP
ncbi:MAG: hypothetical protein KTR31_28585 [Myxococcales bacterium]|nr:hypothetical protein [Myxococcales bacterium]